MKQNPTSSDSFRNIPDIFSKQGQPIEVMFIYNLCFENRISCKRLRPHSPRSWCQSKYGVLQLRRKPQTFRPGIGDNDDDDDDDGNDDKEDDII